MSKTSARGGRPSEYDPKFADMLIDFCSREPFEIKDGKRVATPFPTLAGFAKTIGKHRDTLHQWSKDHAEFSDAIKRLKDAQEHYLVTNGLVGTVNAIFAIFTLKNVNGWRDKQKDEHDVVVNNSINMIPEEELKKRAKELAKKILKESK